MRKVSSRCDLRKTKDAHASKSKKTEDRLNRFPREGERLAQVEKAAPMQNLGGQKLQADDQAHSEQDVERAPCGYETRFLASCASGKGQVALRLDLRSQTRDKRIEREERQGGYEEEAKTYEQEPE
jgi:hypothetical protein